ncbi:MAG TPA: TMEM175 family protein [Bacteroidota bacterium]|nr:TMEM175 family protein [Bacteroidota bacterium]
MIHKFFQERQFRDKYGFRWRGGEISRLETFSDAVFAFSVTLLIVSLEVPKTFSDLMNTMRGFFAFAASFAILLWIWHVHYMYFRRYGLENAFTKVINAFLLFVVLFYVYPLKFVFSNVMHFLSGGANEVALAGGQIVPIVGPGDTTTMMVVYGIGFMAVFFSYTLLYWHAVRRKEELRLSELEIAVTKNFLVNYVLCIGVGLVSIGIALFVKDDGGFYSGISYTLLGPVLGIHGYFSGRRVSQLKEKLNLNQPQRDQRQQRPRFEGTQHQRQQRPQGPHQRPQGQQQRPPGQQQQRRPQQQRPPRPPQQRPPQNPPEQPPPDRNQPR